ncbi:MAG: nitrogen regulation protein NR(II) [Desulfonatronovibrio sp.]
MSTLRKLEEIIGIDSIKLGFFKEVQQTISELRDSNIKLENKRRDIQAILNGIPDVMIVTSLDYKILTVNSAFFETYKIKKPEGLNCYRLLKDSDSPCQSCPIPLAMDISNKVFRSVQILMVEGKNRQIECSASVMQDTLGKPGKVLLMQRDVTKEKQYQAKYFQAERMATIGILAEGVAHEINNPLTSISGFAEALSKHMNNLAQSVEHHEKNDELIDTFKEYLEIILKECNRCSEIVQNLLTFGVKKNLNFSMIDLNETVKNTLKLLRPRLANLPPDTISFELSANSPFVWGHPGELMQVLLNLILNALYAIKDSGKIIISTSIEKGKARLRVADNGHGIKSSHLDKLFEPFFTTKPIGQGIGVGLSTCYNIIRKHNGEILVHSEYTRGSIFEVILPYFME